MICKALELRDRNTFIALLAVKMVPDEPEGVEYIPLSEQELWFKRLWLLRRCGYPTESPYSILLTRLDGHGGKPGVAVDPYDWGDRTFTVAHDYITKNFDALRDGDVVDVEFILGETATPKQSERSNPYA